MPYRKKTLFRPRSRSKKENSTNRSIPHDVGVGVEAAPGDEEEYVEYPKAKEFWDFVESYTRDVRVEDVLAVQGVMEELSTASLKDLFLIPPLGNKNKDGQGQLAQSQQQSLLAVQDQDQAQAPTPQPQPQFQGFQGFQGFQLVENGDLDVDMKLFQTPLILTPPPPDVTPTPSTSKSTSKSTMGMVPPECILGSLGYFPSPSLEVKIKMEQVEEDVKAEVLSPSSILMPPPRTTKVPRRRGRSRSTITTTTHTPRLEISVAESQSVSENPAQDQLALASMSKPSPSQAPYTPGLENALADINMKMKPDVDMDMDLSLETLSLDKVSIKTAPEPDIENNFKVTSKPKDCDCISAISNPNDAGDGDRCMMCYIFFLKKARLDWEVDLCSSHRQTTGESEARKRKNEISYENTSNTGSPSACASASACGFGSGAGLELVTYEPANVNKDFESRSGDTGDHESESERSASGSPAAALGDVYIDCGSGQACLLSPGGLQISFPSCTNNTTAQRASSSSSSPAPAPQPREREIELVSQTIKNENAGNEDESRREIKIEPGCSGDKENSGFSCRNGGSGINGDDGRGSRGKVRKVGQAQGGRDVGLHETDERCDEDDDVLGEIERTRLQLLRVHEENQRSFERFRMGRGRNVQDQDQGEDECHGFTEFTQISLNMKFTGNPNSRINKK